MQNEHDLYDKVMMNNRVLWNLTHPSIAAFLFFCLFSGWGMAETTVRAGAHYSDKAELQLIREDLDKIDGFVASGNYGEASVIVGQAIKARSIYNAYLAKASYICRELLMVRNRLDSQERTITLQQLGALSQKLSLDNARFQGSFTHGEDQFQTYQLIQKAIHNLEDAISYWRISNHYRHMFRGSAREKLEDDELLQTKLQTAINAMDELKVIIETREALTRDLNED